MRDGAVYQISNAVTVIFSRFVGGCAYAVHAVYGMVLVL